MKLAIFAKIQTKEFLIFLQPYDLQIHSGHALPLFCHNQIAF